MNEAEKVVRAVEREVMGYRRGIKLPTLMAMLATLPLVIESALGVEVPVNVDPYKEGERVEVYDVLRSGHHLATVLADQTHGAFGVLVKVERITAPAFVPAELVRRIEYSGSD